MNWTNLHAKLHKSLRKKQLLGKNLPLLVAVSGGQDSLCLLKLLLDLQPKWGWHLAIAHCDHRWSTDAGIADRVAEIARSWNVPFYLETAKQAIKETEAEARKWRYQVLVEIAEREGFQTIVTGHTKSDLAETVVYNLLRGTGADGIIALKPKRSLTPKINLVRPLLEISRSETGEFCQQFNLPVIEDCLNQNLKYSRNRIRTELIPYLQTYFNPQAEKALARAAELLRADIEYLENQASIVLERALAPDRQSLNRLYLRQVSLALQRRAIRQFLQELCPKSPNFDEIEATVYLINAPNKTRTSSFAGGMSAEVQGNHIIFKVICQ